jgi:hypothetical protein
MQPALQGHESCALLRSRGCCCARAVSVQGWLCSSPLRPQNKQAVGPRSAIRERWMRRRGAESKGRDVPVSGMPLALFSRKIRLTRLGARFDNSTCCGSGPQNPGEEVRRLGQGALRVSRRTRPAGGDRGQGINKQTLRGIALLLPLQITGVSVSPPAGQDAKHRMIASLSNRNPESKDVPSGRAACDCMNASDIRDAIAGSSMTPDVYGC